MSCLSLLLVRFTNNTDAAYIRLGLGSWNEHRENIQ